LELVRSLAEAADIFGIRQKFVLRRKKVDTHYRKKIMAKKNPPTLNRCSELLGETF
jgi:hypothetical protein